MRRVLPAPGCVVVQVLAIGFHVRGVNSRHAALPLNFVLLPLCAFVLWGGGKRVPIAPRAPRAPRG